MTTPTMLDYVDRAVAAMNELILAGLHQRPTSGPELDGDVWKTVVEADFLINSVQDALRETAGWRDPLDVPLRYHVEGDREVWRS